MQQKLVTVYLDREGYRVIGQRSPEQSHGTVQEHLKSYLTHGWTIKQLIGAGGGGAGGGGGGSESVGCGWIAVLLEKP